MKVVVNGIGNIGTTVLNILADYKELLGIKEIVGLKNSRVSEWNKEEIVLLKEKGIRILEKIILSEEIVKEELETTDYIFDCNANSFGNKNKYLYSQLSSLKGCSSQGSEKGFGVPFMSGINNEEIIGKKFVQIVSCNTHSLSSILSLFSESNFSTIVESDFVIVRRSEDIGNHQRLVSANVVSRHLDNQIGTHHAIDVKDLLSTIKVDIPIQSSDITTPSQLMHTVRFNLELSHPFDENQFKRKIKENPLISTTNKFDSNVVFDLGRRYSPYGRLFSQVIINSNNLLMDTKTNRIKGWAFIPQEGNTIISSIHAFLLQTQQDRISEKILNLGNNLIRDSW